MSPLKIRFTTDRHGNPLCVIRDIPGPDAELTPSQILALSRALRDAARLATHIDLRQHTRGVHMEWPIPATGDPQ